jgi:hypothetical protein
MKKFLLPAVCLFAASLFPCRAETIIALYSNNRLRHFGSSTPETFTNTVDITGIPSGRTVVAMDFQPSGKLFVVAREGTFIYFYEVNPNTGVALPSPIGLGPWAGTGIGLDFCPPLAGDSRSACVVDDTDRLQRLSPEGAALGPVTMAYDNTTSDGNPVDQHAGDNPAIVALAFSNSFPEATSTVLYGIDATPNSLVVVNRTTGQLDTVGPLGAATGVRCGFDISGSTGTAYAALSSGETTGLYTIDLGTGAATRVGTMGGQLQQVGVTVVDIAVLPATRLVNISTRTRVGTGEDAMIAGFTAVGGAPSHLLIRGLGPSLAAFGVSSPLPNPQLTIFNAQGQIASNDNWKTDQEAAITASGLAPSNDLEAAYLGIFLPGAYTAILRDANNASGVGIIEVYKLSDQ